MGPGSTLAFIAFWVFIAIVAVAGMAYDYRKKQLEMEALRSAIEHGQNLDPAIVQKLLGHYHQPPTDQPQDLRPYLHIGGIITISAGIGIALASLWVGLQFPVVKFPILGIGAIAVCIGIGLLLSARALKRYPPPERSPDRAA
jgi:Domain of unknown function (DUF6249)